MITRVSTEETKRIGRIEIAGGVCSMGFYLVYGIYWVFVGVQIGGPY